MLKKILLAMILLLIAGCAQLKDFKYGIKQVNGVNSRYGTNMETYPNSIPKIDSMINDFQELKKTQLESGQEPFAYVIDYRILNLEAEKLFIEGQKYGSAGTTKGGFGCKTRPLILESAHLRNSSALKGFEAVELLREFIGRYPKEAALANLSLKNALFSNAAFYQISRDAGGDSSTINRFCPQNETFKLYKEEFRKKTNLSEESINSLSYEEAVKIWKGLRGFG